VSSQFPSVWCSLPTFLTSSSSSSPSILSDTLFKSSIASAEIPCHHLDLLAWQFCCSHWCQTQSPVNSRSECTLIFKPSKVYSVEHVVVKSDIQCLTTSNASRKVFLFSILLLVSWSRHLYSPHQFIYSSISFYDTVTGRHVEIYWHFINIAVKCDGSFLQAERKL
jgi:hypothetical protein